MMISILYVGKLSSSFPQCCDVDEVIQARRLVTGEVSSGVQGRSDHPEGCEGHDCARCAADICNGGRGMVVSCQSLLRCSALVFPDFRLPRPPAATTL